MKQCQTKTLQFVKGQTSDCFFGRGNFEFFALLNERAHDVCLSSSSDFVTHICPHFCLFFIPQRVLGHNRRTPWRFLIENAHVKIAVHSHGSSSRYWSCGHHKHIGHCPTVFALVAQRSSLLDTESVLFVNDYHTKAMKLHRLLNESVGTNRNVNTSVGKSRKYIAAPLGRHAARQ
ncbi:unannotated protein [freshwater metagenome]|uniref:Unannotated protein n=1 Tax=freshwater metagenome TaxID=449393 RepID=A0A6J6ZLX7_9ZZZZ